MVVANNDRQAINLAPGVVLAGHASMLDTAIMSDVKVVVNCGSTSNFLRFLDEYQPVVSSDIIVLNLDPYASSADPPYMDFHSRFNRVLQNYLAFFYSYNKDVQFFINSNYENSKLSLDSPTMNGVPLRLLFNINRLLKLIKNVNGTAGFLFVSGHFGLLHHSNALLYALAMLYLMDNYNYNFEASYRFLQSLLPPPGGASATPSLFPVAPDLFNPNHYDDVLLIDSLKKFYVENGKIKQSESGVMTRNFKLKRSIESLDSVSTMRPVKRMA
ncbi:hypothetical protein METBIDRAFT_29710 [Metschnikowia bicuspidata var. bicuspidata NRRL YB-4993]|uniref:Uncharacterized protein n=1 Tax=Metschnikowia bicuspidata var. bicuspidata NRRL YB-4993 TaxID=869754 RepID=A0A1A0HG95_9ASCO|nr:hypothetical protein METBIDRAFT_29710 [Metschnikowia bicuspidata var. bicuspidata NRRL YB-4993]OBA23184.1 hypothetical protein METBIDRAFT_29710 [Metschnikowia bicuspidata var. bicuspidata NRRL YB-4993]